MTITITKLYQLLVEKTDKKTAEALTTYIEEKIDADIKDKTETLATKEDIAKVKVEMIRWYVALFVTLMLMIAGLYLKK